MDRLREEANYLEEVETPSDLSDTYALERYLNPLSAQIVDRKFTGLDMFGDYHLGTPLVNFRQSGKISGMYRLA